MSRTISPQPWHYKNQLLLRFKNLLKSTVRTDRLKAPKILNITLPDRLFHTSRTLLVKKCVLTPLHLSLYNLYRMHKRFISDVLVALN